METHGSGGLLASSAGRGWSGLAAELCSHSGVIAWRNPRPDTEICVDVHGGASVSRGRENGITDRTVSERRTIWLSHLPPSQFLLMSLGEESDPSAVASLRAPRRRTFKGRVP